LAVIHSIVLIRFLLGFGVAPGAEPPTDLLGQFLYVEEGPEDDRVFIDGSNAEEGDPAGDLDAVTDTDPVTGTATADLVVTRDVDH
jgi:hypothetical protein